MSILARNIKIIRKELRCTQSAMSSILKVGFRTYVRYEAGERDAPVSALVKISNLGNLSLESLLTREIKPYNVMPFQASGDGDSGSEVKECNFKGGQISFRKPARERLLTIDDSEKKLIAIFRKMTPDRQNEYLSGMEDASVSSREKLKAPKKAKTSSPRKSAGKTRKTSATAAPKAPKAKRKGKPGRKKLDKKALKDKIDKLKMITRSISKITVR